MSSVPFSNLLGRTIQSIAINDGCCSMVRIVTSDGLLWETFQDECGPTTVSVEEVIGDTDDLIGHPLTMAEEVSSNDPSDDRQGTWTFYKLATVKGYVTIRFLGEGNGYYSETVSTYCTGAS